MLRIFVILLILYSQISLANENSGLSVYTKCGTYIKDSFVIQKCKDKVQVNIELPPKTDAIHCYAKGSFIIKDGDDDIYYFSSESERIFHGRRSVSSHLIPVKNQNITFEFLSDQSSPVGVTKLKYGKQSFLQNQILKRDLSYLILSLLLIFSGFFVFGVGAFIKLSNIIPLSIFSIFMGSWTFFTRDSYTRNFFFPNFDPHAFDIGIISAYIALWALLKFMSSLPFGKFRDILRFGSYISFMFALVGLFCALIHIPVRTIDPYFNFFMMCIAVIIGVGLIRTRENFYPLQLTSVMMILFGGCWDAISYLLCKSFPQLLATIIEGFHLLHISLLISVILFFITMCNDRLKRHKKISSSEFIYMNGHEFRQMLVAIVLEAQDSGKLDQETIKEVEDAIKMFDVSDQIHEIKRSHFEIGKLDSNIKSPNLVVYSDKMLIQYIVSNINKNIKKHGNGNATYRTYSKNQKVWLEWSNTPSNPSRKFKKGWGLRNCYYIADVLGEKLEIKKSNDRFLVRLSLSVGIF